MPTADRRLFVPQAIRCFQSQDYLSKELVIVDDGADCVADLVPEDPQIRYIRLSGSRVLGAKRNECVEACRSDLIMHWDDDDWMAPHRISYQVAALLREDAEICGLQQMLFYHLDSDEVWLYQYPDNQCPWLAGGSLLYTRDFWRRSPFPTIQVASDTRFVWDRPMDRRVALGDYRFYVAMAHETNTSPKSFNCSYWTRYTDSLEPFMGDDLGFYKSLRQQTQTSQPKLAAGLAATASETDSVSRSSIPTYSILMVVHNALAMTRLSTLKTLQHINGQDARLVVVDNASTDGTEQWLKLLAQRGDIDLISSETNLGHGPALELARSKTQSPYIVALDSDAFPLCDEWLPRLRAALSDRVKVAGIRHHRDYVHPACLLIARETLDDLNLSFLNEKDQPSQFDVAERISHEVKQRGYQIAGLKRTSAQRRGSVSEPVYLGSEYEGLVYHQWYTTRAETSAGGLVDDVPAGAIETSLDELFERNDSAPREVTVVMGIRAAAAEPERLANARICLQALNLQNLSRWRYRIVVVEQDEQPRLARELAPFVDKYVFAYNPGPYNRGWGFNVGACAGGSAELLCLIDADLLVPPDFLQRGLQSFESGKRAILPYTEVLYLDAPATEIAIGDYLAAPLLPLETNKYQGRLFDTSQGGCIWVASSLYQEIGGHDERFRGWGREDREFWERLNRATESQQLPGRQLHLNHTRPQEEDSWATANQVLYDQIAASSGHPAPREIGNPNLYKDENGSSKSPRALGHHRDWEHWHKWNEPRITKIVEDEQRRLPTATSNRFALAEMLVRLGDSLLDVGCGPGALWPYLGDHQPRFSWAGADVTPAMLNVAHKLFPEVYVAAADAGSLPFGDQSFDVVLLRHVLEYLPQWLMEQALQEAMRVARRTVVLDFYVPPNVTGASNTRRVGDFLETQWALNDLQLPIATASWVLDAQSTLQNGDEEQDVIWILTPKPETNSEQLRSTQQEPLKVSIIMPTYRRSHTLFRTVQTIQQQTYRNWELIIIDNEATTSDYRFNDQRIRVYAHGEKVSASYARNKGLSYATGDLVCFFDDDDTMFSSYLQMFVNAFAANPAVKMVRCGMIVSGGRTNFSYATPECCLRREIATPTWTNLNTSHDQLYFKSIVEAQGWSEAQGDIITVREALCQANWDPVGGLRSGRL